MSKMIVKLRGEWTVKAILAYRKRFGAHFDYVNNLNWLIILGIHLVYKYI